MLERISVERQIGKNLFRIETGALGKQASGCCTVQYGETVTLSAAATGPARPGMDYFPLTCDYRERTAAAGFDAHLVKPIGAAEVLVLVNDPGMGPVRAPYVPAPSDKRS